MGQFKLLWVNAARTKPKDNLPFLFGRLFEVTEVDAWELHAGLSRACDVVCFDFDYPDISGLKLIPQAKQRWPSAPILMLTMQSSSELAIWALRSRVFDMLVKPATVQEVDRMSERVIQAITARRSQGERRPQASSAQVPSEMRYRPQSPSNSRLETAVAHVAKNYLQPMAESEVAQLCNMSPSRFCREFKAAFDVTFVEYLATYRIVQAKRLLANPTISVADVANAVGYSDPSYFTRVFRKQEGISPSEFRAARA